MSTKTGLTNFAAQLEAREPVSDEPIRRNKGEVVQYTIRVSNADWARLRAFAAAEDTTLQAVTIAALSMFMKSYGLPPLKPYNGRGG